MSRAATKHLPSLSILNERLSYDPDTGIFTYLITGRRMKAGQRAGHLLNTGYRMIAINGRQYAEHRLALVMTGTDVIDEIDHINGIRDDNRLCNLRLASRGENNQNKSLSKNNTTGYTGVHFRGRNKYSKYEARIGMDGKKISLGSFRTPEEACSAYLEAKRRLHTFHPTQRT